MLRIRDTFPMLRPYAPEGCKHVGYRGRSLDVEGFTTHESVFDPRWVVDAESFCAAPFLPDGFFATGARFAGHEWLFVMWARGGRRLHFEGLYFGGGFVEATGRDLYADVRAGLTAILARWEATSDPIVTSTEVVLEDLAWRDPQPHFRYWGVRQSSVAGLPS